MLGPVTYDIGERLKAIGSAISFGNSFTRCTWPEVSVQVLTATLQFICGPFLNDFQSASELS